MLIQANEKKASELYHLMTQMIVPRPVAWVLTENESKNYNLAPFSYFNGVSSDPPILMFSAGMKRSGPKKDTVLNIEKKKYFVVHIASVEHAETVTSSADELEYGESEIEKLGLKLVSEQGWVLPRLEIAKIAILCSLDQIIEVGTKPQHLILGEIQSLWISQDVAAQEGNKIIIDPKQLDPLARLGRSRYARINPL